MMWINRATQAYSIADLREMTARRLPKGIFDFFDGGAEDEINIQDNCDAFQRLRFVPHILMDVSEIDTSLEIFGKKSELPIAIAPTGGTGFGRWNADIAIAKAAAQVGIPYTLSTSATTSIERVMQEAPGRMWFQAYILKNKELLWKLIDRALSADYEALMITVDLPVGGKRERDLHNGMTFPFRFSLRHAFDFLSHPLWLYEFLRHGFPVIENLVGIENNVVSASRIASSVGRNYDPSFNWNSLKIIRDRWPRKLIVKGVLRPDDAQKLLSIGVDAIVVSNHGGRQLDGTIAPIDALPSVANAVGGKIEVWVDGGIRRGSDIVKARAMGAHGVLVGRAPLYGALSGGQPGASRAISILADELIRTMQLCGITSLNEINESLLV